jgi:hypothetical protein
MINGTWYKNKLFFNRLDSNLNFHLNKQIHETKKLFILKTKEKEYTIFLNQYKKFKQIKFFCKIFWEKSNFLNNIPFYILPSRSIVWFRADLDWEENFVLKFALTLSINPVFIYFHDKNEQKRWSTKRKKFFENTLERLKKTFSLQNIEFFVFENNLMVSISRLIKKYKSPYIIYSLNTFVPLNKKKEKRMVNKLENTGTRPIIFIFDPLTMKYNYCSQRKRYSGFFSFLSEKISFDKNNSKKKNLNTLNFLDKLNINGLKKEYEKNYNKKDDIVVKESDIIVKRLLEIELDGNILKNIFSEFSLGLRYSFKIINLNSLIFKSIMEKIKLNSYLKFFFCIKSLIKRKDKLFHYITNFDGFHRF